MRLNFLSNGEDAAVQCGSVAFQLTAMILFIASIRDCCSPWLTREASGRRVAIVAFPGVTLLDISGPAQVFAELQEIELPTATYSLSYLSASGGLVSTDVGMMVDTAPISGVRPHQVDTLVIPGGPGI